eukprot:TRINITY_DN8540_c0_g1_i1.p1 TRINITY_DN8540_c0_g1~~TRINITY_DN8540_c0_g1_i1.p1  ORF type:complete len:442 (+),score=118.67 TRINITY_DN8540_c0_g1_i1:130-1455(+)
MRLLYFVDDRSKIVFTYEAVGDGSWVFSRVADCHKAQSSFHLLYKRNEEKPEESSWQLQDRTPTALGSRRDECFGTPVETSNQEPSRPPLGRWKVWNAAFILTDEEPQFPPLNRNPFVFEVDFAKMSYYETGNVANLDISLLSTPITDEEFKKALFRFRQILLNLARRPKMILMIRSDGRIAAMPSMRHIREYMAFIQENGSEFVLVGRGHAIVLSPRSVLGMAILNLVKMVQRMFPPPWEEKIVAAQEEATAFLQGLLQTMNVSTEEKMEEVSTDRSTAQTTVPATSSQAGSVDSASMSPSPATSPSPSAAAAAKEATRPQPMGATKEAATESGGQISAPAAARLISTPVRAEGATVATKPAAAAAAPKAGASRTVDASLAAGSPGKKLLTPLMSEEEEALKADLRGPDEVIMDSSTVGSHKERWWCSLGCTPCHSKDAS